MIHNYVRIYVPNTSPWPNVLVLKGHLEFYCIYLCDGFVLTWLWAAYSHAETCSTHAEVLEVTRSSIQSIVHSLLTSPHNEIKYKTPKTGIEGHTEPHKWSQQPSDSNLLTF